MAEQKIEQVNLRMSPRAKALLRLAAEREHRSASNMVEYLVLKFCENEGISLDEPSGAIVANKSLGSSPKTNQK